jgi:hypothetical protein
MGFLTEMLAVAVVWLSSFALCQFGVACGASRLPARPIAALRSRTVARYAARRQDDADRGQCVRQVL